MAPAHVAGRHSFKAFRVLEMGLGDSSYPTKRSGWWVLIFEPKSNVLLQSFVRIVLNYLMPLPSADLPRIVSG